MIQLEELAFAFNEHIGRGKFNIYLNTNGVPQSDSRILGTLNVGRIPYGFTSDEINAENLTLTFTFDIPCGSAEADRTRDNAAAILAKKLLGWQRLTVTAPNGETYRINSFLELQPMGAPYVDCGEIKQQFVYSGTALAQNTTCGAIVGNEEAVYIDGSQVLKLSKTVSTQIAGDNKIPLSEEKYTADVESIGVATTLTISCLYIGSEIDELLYRAGEGVILNPNKIYTIETVRNTLAGAIKVVQNGKLTGVTSKNASGVFLQYEATFQIVGEPYVDTE